MWPLCWSTKISFILSKYSPVIYSILSGEEIFIAKAGRWFKKRKLKIRKNIKNDLVNLDFIEYKYQYFCLDVKKI